MKHFRFIIALAVIIFALTAFYGMAHAGPECTCRHSGGDVQEGQTACIKSPTGMQMARCERVQNNTSWKMLDAPCPYSQAPTLQTENFSVALLDFSNNSNSRD